MDEVEVSVVLPVYNGSPEITQAIDSLVNQTVRPTEVIIVDDGSTDKTLQKISQYSDKYNSVQVLTHTTNKGLPAALNTAIEAATNPYLARQDADDRSLPQRIETQYEYMKKHPSAAAVGTSAQVVDAAGNHHGTIRPPANPASVLQQRNPFVHGSVMLRTDAIKDVGGYDTAFKNAQDYDLWIRLHRAGYELHGLSSILYELRRSRPHLSIEQRQHRILYGIAARAKPSRKSTYRSQLASGDVSDMYNLLRRHERAIYNRQSAESCIKHGVWKKAIHEVLPALFNEPTSPRTAAIVGLSLLPPPVSRRLLKIAQTF